VLNGYLIQLDSYSFVVCHVEIFEQAKMDGWMEVFPRQSAEKVIFVYRRVTSFVLVGLGWNCISSLALERLAGPNLSRDLAACIEVSPRIFPPLKPENPDRTMSDYFFSAQTYRKAEFALQFASTPKAITSPVRAA